MNIGSQLKEWGEDLSLILEADIPATIGIANVNQDLYFRNSPSDTTLSQNEYRILYHPGNGKMKKVEQFNMVIRQPAMNTGGRAIPTLLNRLGISKIGGNRWDSTYASNTNLGSGVASCLALPRYRNDGSKFYSPINFEKERFDEIVVIIAFTGIITSTRPGTMDDPAYYSCNLLTS